jgi:hypothetical protein
MGFLVICVGITILQMSKVDPTQFTKLDRRSTMLFQAARNQTEAVEEKSLSGIEEPGIDTLRGSFGTVGSIIRARSARRVSQSSRASAPSNRFGASTSRFDMERGDSKLSSSSGVPNLNHYGGMKKHQLFDPPVPPLPHLDSSDSISLSSQQSARKTAIKFGEQDVIHSYHRGIAGKDDLATHERRVVPRAASPLSPPGSSAQPSLTPLGNVSAIQLQRQQSPDTFNSVSAPQFDPGASAPRSAPPGVGGAATGAYRDPFEGAPASATLPLFSATSLVDENDPRYQPRRTFSHSRQGSARDYPKGDRADDAEERVSLWDPQRDNTSETDIAVSPDSPYGTVRLVNTSRPGRF